jgi:MFS family permease
MAGFGKRLLQSRHEPWAASYIDYERLKRALLLKQLGMDDSGRSVDSRRAVLIAEEHSREFRRLIDEQIEKVVLFFLNKQGELARRLTELTDSSQEQVIVNTQADYEYFHECVDIGEELILLINFVELNVTGLRKIFKKHDKRFYRTPIAEQYLTSHVYGKDSHLQQMYHYGGIAALAETLKRRLKAVNGNHQACKTSYSTLVLPATQEAQYILHKIEDARRRLNESSRYANAMAAQALIFETGDAESINSELRTDRIMSNLINLASTFLYMTNYYIVAPTSGAYAARLGMSEALAGIIIGMTPCAALAASVLYSWWSNRSYRHALLFAATCSIVGDILYALALPFNSIPLIIIGRLLNGFGGARAINRRYIADAFSRNERTAASAAFVTAGALGLAAGPALAVIADQLTPNQITEGGDWWTVETAPGWIMVVLWSTFLVTAFLHFEEPEPRGGSKIDTPVLVLEEQPLITNENVEQIIAEKLSPPLYKNAAVMTSLVIYFVLKLVLECLLSSTGTVTSFYFHWNATHVGLFLAVLGLLIFPANMIVAIISRRHEDREIVIATELIILVGTASIIGYFTDTYSVYQYIAASLFCFLGTNMLEAPSMSILSKTIPQNWAKGTFNSGLLATEAGTLGRVVGDVIISAAGLAGIERILDLTFVPMTAIVFVTLLVTWRMYGHLEPDEDEDD